MNKTRHIAIVDDHTMFRKGLCALINLFSDYAVIIDAANGLDLIRQMDTGPLPEIILLDIAKPSAGGYQFAAWVKHTHPAIKLLALSTMEPETAILRMILAGARGYVLKDAEPAVLQAALDQVYTTGYYYGDPLPASAVAIGAVVPPLSKIEYTFLELTCSEMTYYDMAKTMSLSTRMVEALRDLLFQRLGIYSRIGLALFALRYRIVSP